MAAGSWLQMEMEYGFVRIRAVMNMRSVIIVVRNLIRKLYLQMTVFRLIMKQPSAAYVD